MHNNRLQSSCLSDIGNIYDDEDQYEQALGFKLRAKKLIASQNDESMMGTLLLGLGDTNEMLNRLDSARFYTEAAYESAVRLKDEDRIGIALNNLGNIHSKMGQVELAMSYYRLSMADYIDQSDYEGICEISYGMARLFQKNKQLDSVLYYARLSLSLAQKYGFTRWVLKSSELMAGFFNEAHNIDSVFAYQQITISAKDSLYSQEKTRAVENLSFEETLRQQELAGQQLHAAETRKRNLQLAGIAIFIPCFCLFVIFLSRRKAKAGTVEFLGILALLLVFEFVTLLIHPYIENLTDDAPVIMLVILVAVAAFLVPLHHKMEKLVKERLVHRSPAKQSPVIADELIQPS